MSEQQDGITYSKAIRTAIINDLLDFLLFFVGVFLPFGDAIESPISLLLELLIIFRLFSVAASFRNGRLVMFIIIILEFFDLTDLIMGGAVDFLGWVEIIPFWTLFVWYNEERFMERSASSDGELERWGCPECGTKNPGTARICETCGYQIR